MIGSLSKARSLLRWLAVLLCCLLGCQTASDISEEDHESHEHFPPHWPHTIFNASGRLKELIGNSDAAASTEVIASDSLAQAETPIASHQEFVDLVGWLPILAADSDLDRAAFTRIDAAVAKLESKWRKSPPQDLQVLADDPETREMLKLLDDICQQEQARIQQTFDSP